MAAWWPQDQTPVTGRVPPWRRDHPLSCGYGVWLQLAVSGSAAALPRLNQAPMQFPYQLEDDGILGAFAKQPCPGGMVLH